MGIVMKYAVISVDTGAVLSEHYTWEQAIRAVWQAKVDCVIRERDEDGDERVYDAFGLAIDRKTDQDAI